jgi:hypothetical protein
VEGEGGKAADTLRSLADRQAWTHPARRPRFRANRAQGYVASLRAVRCGPAGPELQGAGWRPRHRPDGPFRPGRRLSLKKVRAQMLKPGKKPGMARPSAGLGTPSAAQPSARGHRMPGARQHRDLLAAGVGGRGGLLSTFKALTRAR